MAVKVLCFNIFFCFVFCSWIEQKNSCNYVHLLLRRIERQNDSCFFLNPVLFSSNRRLVFIREMCEIFFFAILYLSFTFSIIIIMIIECKRVIHTHTHTQKEKKQSSRMLQRHYIYYIWSFFILCCLIIYLTPVYVCVCNDNGHKFQWWL